MRTDAATIFLYTSTSIFYNPVMKKPVDIITAAMTEAHDLAMSFPTGSKGRQEWLSKAAKYAAEAAPYMQPKLSNVTYRDETPQEEDPVKLRERLKQLINVIGEENDGEP